MEDLDNFVKHMLFLFLLLVLFLHEILPTDVLAKCYQIVGGALLSLWLSIMLTLLLFLPPQTMLSVNGVVLGGDR